MTKSNAQALSFGAWSYISIGNILSNNQSYTKEAWIRIHNYSTSQGYNILSAWDQPFWLENGVLCGANGYGNTGIITVQDGSAIPLEEWVHVAVTYDAASTTMKLYKNGQLVSTNTSAPSYIINTGLQIGAQEHADWFSGGDLDEVRLWNGALTQAQILANMNCDVQGNSALMAYYKFDEGTPAGNNTSLPYATDYSGNGHNGTFIEFSLTGNIGNYITGRTIYSVSGITGGSSACSGHTISLSDATTGGTWSSSNTGLATVGSTGVVNGVSGGSPIISYTSSNGCIATKSLTIYSSPSVSATTTNVTCNGGNNGNITTSISGGTSGYSYLWSNSATTTGLSSLSAGTYSVTVTDAHSCTTTGSYTLTQPSATSASITITPSNTTFTGGDNHNIYLGYGPQSAAITASATGGSGYTYSWSSATYLSSTSVSNPTFTPTAAGHYTYTCTVTNSGGCTSKGTVAFCVVDAADHSHSGKVLICHDGSSTLSISSNAVDAHLTNHGDHLGVCYGGCGTGAKQSNPGAQTVIMENGITVTAYPNPFNDDMHVKLETEFAELASVTVYDLTGRVLEQKNDQDPGTEIIVGNSLKNGMYILEIRQGDNSKKIKIVKN